jgi:c-di-GMP-binding flagellar brake protein YcgR
MNIDTILYPGKVIKLINSEDSAWEFGINRVVAEGQIICSLLLDHTDLPELDAGGAFRLAISHGSGVYMVKARAVVLSEEDIVLKFFLSDEYEFVQRREFYRLVEPEIQVDCKIYGEIYKAKALDLAGGGIGLQVKRDRNIKKDTLLELKIVFPDENIVQLSARAAHVVPAEEPDNYVIGAYFTKITNSDEAKIMKYIFSEQIRKHKEAQQSLSA